MGEGDAALAECRRWERFLNSADMVAGVPDVCPETMLVDDVLPRSRHLPGAAVWLVIVQTGECTD